MSLLNWPSLHFLVSDFTGILTAFLLFSLVAFFPGYALGWLGNPLNFRRRTLPFRIAFSVPLALAAAPIIGYTVGRWFGLGAVWFVYAGMCATALITGVLQRSGTKPSGISLQSLWPFFGLIGLWIAIAFVALADLPLRHRLYFSVIDFDYSVRIAFTHSIAAFGLPARNPFFLPGHAAGLRYHYFWMVVCAEIGRLTGDSRTAFIAGTMWTGIGLISLIPVFLRTQFPGVNNLLQRTRIGIGLLAVTGLDLIPALLMLWLNRIGLVGGVSPSVEWWNDQVDGLLYTMLWEPHYTCALVACLTGFLIIRSVTPESSRRESAIAGVLAGMALASAAGSGIYVAIVFAAFLGLWFTVSLIRTPWRTKEWSTKAWRTVETMAIAGILALVLVQPFLSSLVERSGPAGTSSFPLELTVRSFVPIELVLRILQFNLPWQRYLADLLLLPLNYFLEFGVFFVVGRTVWARFRDRKTPVPSTELAGLLMAGTSILICTFVKSSIIANNDLGWRGMLPAQFMLLLWAANLLSERSFRTRGVRFLLVLGVAGVLYDFSILRLYPVLSDMRKAPKINWIGEDDSVGLRTFANREAYEWIRARTPETAIVQPNPAPVFQDTTFGAYGQRQTVAIGGACSTAFGGREDECAVMLPTLTSAFESGGGTGLVGLCRSFPIDLVVAKDTDAVWRDRDSWVWNSTPVFHNNFVRVFDCKAL